MQLDHFSSTHQLVPLCRKHNSYCLQKVFWCLNYTPILRYFCWCTHLEKKTHNTVTPHLKNTWFLGIMPRIVRVLAVDWLYRIAWLLTGNPWLLRITLLRRKDEIATLGNGGMNTKNNKHVPPRCLCLMSQGWLTTREERGSERAAGLQGGGDGSSDCLISNSRLLGKSGALLILLI